MAHAATSQGGGGRQSAEYSPALSVSRELEVSVICHTAEESDTLVHVGCSNRRNKSKTHVLKIIINYVKIKSFARAIL